jgi:hypothetical protein
MHILNEPHFRPPKIVNLLAHVRDEALNCRGCQIQTAMIQASGGTTQELSTYINPRFLPFTLFSPVLLPLIITMCLESTLSHFIVECPATCELCAHWLPNHAVSTTLP